LWIGVCVSSSDPQVWFDAFDFTVLCEHTDANYLLNSVESEFIAVMKPEYNVTLGGEGVLKERLSEEHKQKLRDNHADFNGERNPFFGKTHTAEVRSRIAESKRGKPGPNKGRTFSEESRKRMSEAAKKRRVTPHLNKSNHAAEF
jgi:group I intron endonuclease